ncbi:MAG: phospholipase [Candidatus Thorarchaeota archaeon]|nr:MAG: phospholipase [Candidatus Thorarchaeota archaeon]
MIKNKKIIPTLAIVISILLLFTLFSGCIDDIPDDPNTHIRSITHGGLERTYRIHIPPSFNKTIQMPLVLVLHGGGGTAEGMEEQLTLGGFNNLSDKKGFIVVYPNGIEKRWNDCRKNISYRTHQEKIDDVGFISTLIDNITEEFNINPGRVYVTGMSNGAMMSYRLACEISEKIAAIAPVTGAIPEDIISQCSPSKPVSVIAISGTDDPLVPWEGGDIKSLFLHKPLGKVLSVPDSVNYWAIHNNCSPMPNITWLPDLDPRDDTRVRREVYGEGDEGTKVILYAIEGGGHTWPDGLQYLSESLIGKTCHDINANEVIWEFFTESERV